MKLLTTMAVLAASATSAMAMDFEADCLGKRREMIHMELISHKFLHQYGNDHWVVESHDAADDYLYCVEEASGLSGAAAQILIADNDTRASVHLASAMDNFDLYDSPRTQRLIKEIADPATTVERLETIAEWTGKGRGVDHWNPIAHFAAVAELEARG